MEAVCILLSSNTDWESAKRLLANVKFLKMLQEYKKDNIDQKILHKLKE